MKRSPCFICGLAIRGYDAIPIPKTWTGRLRFWLGLRVLSTGRRCMRITRTLLKTEIEEMES